MLKPIVGLVTLLAMLPLVVFLVVLGQWEIIIRATLATAAPVLIIVVMAVLQKLRVRKFDRALRPQKWRSYRDERLSPESDLVR